MGSVYARLVFLCIPVFFVIRSIRSVWSAPLAAVLTHVQPFGIPWTIAHQAPLSVRFSRQEYWSGLPFPSPGDLPDPGIEPTSLALAGGFFTTAPPGMPQHCLNLYF